MSAAVCTATTISPSRGTGSSASARRTPSSGRPADTGRASTVYARAAMPEPEWSDFRVVLALHRGGSFAGAARLLGVDASTVSRRLAAIEKAVGAILIVRGGRELTLTAEGRAVVDAAASMDEAVTAATASVRASRADLQGTVRLTAVPSLTEFLSPFPGLVEAREPGLGVELRFSRGVVDLARGDADIAVRTERDLPGDLILRHSFDLGSGLYASTPYLDAAGRLDTAGDLRRHRLALYTEEFRGYPLAAWLEQFGEDSPRSMRADSVDLARA